ncbi:MAG: hypothetical protein KJ065_01140 [Anaerolineae bacterium]|nr:hypothetical protein [Anaerolineae bacterium]
MRLDQYQWSHNPRGLHVATIYETPLPIDRYRAMNCGWCKIIAAGYEYVDDCATLLAQGITPIVRLYLGRWGARPMDRFWRDIMFSFASVGVKWFEFYNEPNLDVEWPQGFDPDWRDFENVIRPLMDNWLTWAEFTITLGAYPGFIPLAESDNPRYAAVRWMDAFLSYQRDAHLERFQAVLANGAWCSTHPYILNHFYQETPGGGPWSARRAEDQRAEEGGWHFEYPYDPISQRNDPGRTVYGGTALTPNGDPVGLIAMGRMFNERCGQYFGTQAVPVVGTEGGIFPFRGGDFQQDTRYPAYSEVNHGDATAALFRWCAEQAPPWFFGLTLWKEDEYYIPGPVRAIGRLGELPVYTKQVPAIEVMGSGFFEGSRPVPQYGPGPIQGQADFHIVLLAPGLDADWFFDTSRAYWERFRPIVTTDLSLVDYIPFEQSAAITVISPPELMGTLRRAVTLPYPNAYLDLIEAVDLGTVARIFDNRVVVNRRFG